MKIQGQAEVRACLPAAFASVCLAFALLQAVTVAIAGGVVVLASVANETIVQSGFGTPQPLIHQLYPGMYSRQRAWGCHLLTCRACLQWTRAWPAAPSMEFEVYCTRVDIL